MKHFNLLEKVFNISAERYFKTAGKLFIYEGNYAAALSLINKTLELEPENIRALVLKGDILFCLNRDIEALQLLNKAISFKPRFIEAYVSKAGILDALGEYREALDACNKAFELAEDRHHYLLSILYEQKISLLIDLKKFREAQSVLGTASEKLIPEEFQVLHEYFCPLITRGRQIRSQKERTAGQHDLKVISAAPTVKIP